MRTAEQVPFAQAISFNWFSSFCCIKMPSCVARLYYPVTKEQLAGQRGQNIHCVSRHGDCENAEQGCSHRQKNAKGTGRNRTAGTEACGVLRRQPPVRKAAACLTNSSSRWFPSEICGGKGRLNMVQSKCYSKVLLSTARRLTMLKTRIINGFLACEGIYTR